MDTKEFNVRGILAGEAPQDAPVTVMGWVRTRRDSKAGISFVHLSDGSSFHPVQVVAPNTLPNYEDEVLRLTAGCAVEATGTIVPSPAKGQPFEMQASALRVIGWAADQRDRGGNAGAAHAGTGDPSLLRRERLFLGQYADHYGGRRGGRGGAV